MIHSIMIPPTINKLISQLQQEIRVKPDLDCGNIQSFYIIVQVVVTVKKGRQFLLRI